MWLVRVVAGCGFQLELLQLGDEFGVAVRGAHRHVDLSAVGSEIDVEHQLVVALCGIGFLAKTGITLCSLVLS